MKLLKVAGTVAYTVFIWLSAFVWGLILADEPTYLDHVIGGIYLVVLMPLNIIFLVPAMIRNCK